MPIRRTYGQIPDKPDPHDYKLAEHVTLPTADALPTSMDLRSGGFLSDSIFDQLALGSCVENATAENLMYVQRKLGLPTIITPSRLAMYYWVREIEGTTGEDAGSEIRDALKVVAGKPGFVPESEWPYDIDKFTDAPPANVRTDAAKDLATKYMRVAVSTASLKQALAAGFVVVVGFTVFESFESDAVASTGEVPMPARGEQELGGHAALCVGYDDYTQRFICRNSWGPDWGQDGYFTMPYAYLGSATYASDFWAVQVVTEGSDPTPPPAPGDPLHELAALLRQFMTSLQDWFAKHNL